MTPELDERALLTHAAEGDDEALAVLLGQFGPAVRGQVEVSLGDKWRSLLDADDVMQITYLEAFLQIGRFENRGDGAFRAWLTRIAENNLRDAIRELERFKRPQPEQRIVDPRNSDTSVALLEQLSGTSASPSRAANLAEVKRSLDSALDELPDDYAAVIRLYDLESRPVEEVAAALCRSPGAVFMLRSRAHDRLREQMGPATKFFTHAP